MGESESVTETRNNQEADQKHMWGNWSDTWLYCRPHSYRWNQRHTDFFVAEMQLTASNKYPSLAGFWRNGAELFSDTKAEQELKKTPWAEKHSKKTSIYIIQSIVRSACRAWETDPT